MKRKGDNGESKDRRAANMKRKLDNGEFEHAPRKGKQMLKRGGGGLSLEAFAAAKSKPLINPAQIREHREFYQNAKKVQKYKKLVKRLGGQGPGAQAQVEEGVNKPADVQAGQLVNDDPTRKKNGAAGFLKKRLPIMKTDGKQFKSHQKHRQQHKGISHLERIREAHEKEKLERENERKEREMLFAEQEETRDKVLHARKEVRARMRKKTQRGQPVMKDRIEQLLETIQRDSR